MKPNLDELGGLYSATLEEYLLRGTEAALHRSYELGRRALTEGLGVLEMIALHQQAMGKILLEMATPEKRVEAVQKGSEFLAEGSARRTGLRITVEGGNGNRLPGVIETALYRVVQEALNNVSKHARATRVQIRVWRTDKLIRCSVSDDGRGFEAASMLSGPDRRGLGLLGIYERLNALGGAVEIDSAPGRGTALQIQIPMED